MGLSNFSEEEPGFKAFKINYCFQLKLDSRGEVEKLIVKENECLVLLDIHSFLLIFQPLF